MARRPCVEVGRGGAPYASLVADLTPGDSWTRQPLWANFEKLISLAAEPARSQAHADLDHVAASPLGAHRVSIADELWRYFEPNVRHCASPDEVHALKEGVLFAYEGREMHCRGMALPDADDDAMGRIRIGKRSGPSWCEGAARLSHGLVSSVDGLGMNARKFVLAAKVAPRTFIPLIAGLCIARFEPSAGALSPRYLRVRPRFPAAFADRVIDTLRHECENAHSWQLFQPSVAGGKVRERSLQTVFELVCSAVRGDFDVSVDPQVDHGVGTVDVCVSSGAADACCIELKLSTHDRLRHGLEIQLPTYMRARRATDGRFVVLCVDGGKSPEQVGALLANASPPSGTSIRTVLIDGRSRPSASRL